MYKDKKITIIGLGKTGWSCINFFLSRNIVPRVIDIRSRDMFSEKLPNKVFFHFGSWNIDLLLSSDLIVLSPGVSLKVPELQLALNKGIEIVSDIEIFSREVNKPVISITGSNGKSTVATMLFEIAKSFSLNVAFGGNIGVPALNLLNKEYDLYILEISSFQLERTFNLKSKISVILNITNDHMDRYNYNFEEYVCTKLKIYDNSKICLYNIQDLCTWPTLILEDKSKKFFSFGINAGDYSLNNKDNLFKIREKCTLNIKRFNCYHMRYNYLNMLVALSISDLMNFSIKKTFKTLMNFKGLKYRMELICIKNEVKWINDSKSTNIASTIFALRNLRNIEGLIYLIVGGKEKSGNINFLKDLIQKDNIRLFCYGLDGYKLASLRLDSFLFDSLEECLHSIKYYLKPGDTVLLSPGCSSLDQFSSFEERGKLFNKFIEKFI